MSQDFKDKVVVITGASSGIGECTAILFAQHGAHVVLCGRDEKRLSSVVQKCQDKSGGHVDRYLSVQGDISDAHVRRRIIQETVDKFGRIDILVPNAGILLKEGSIEETTEAAFDQTMSVNVKAVYFLILEAIPHLEKTKGCVINVSSVYDTIACTMNIPYGISKAAVNYMTRTFALGLAPKGIRVNAISPTVVRTNMLRDFNYDDEQLKKNYSDFEQLHPLHGRISTSEEQASVILFLASSGASFITGQCIIVDGGLSLKIAGV